MNFLAVYGPSSTSADPYGTYADQRPAVQGRRQVNNVTMARERSLDSPRRSGHGPGREPLEYCRHVKGRIRRNIALCNTYLKARC